MSKVQCYGCQEYGHYKRYCSKLKKDNNKINEAHITNEVEVPEKKKSKKDEVKDLYYDLDNLLHLVIFSLVNNSYHDRKHSMNDMIHHGRIWHHIRSIPQKKELMT